MNVLDLHFKSVMDELERKAAVAGADFHDIFGDASDDLFAYLTKKEFSGYKWVKNTLPDYPSEEVNADCTGNLSIHESVREALTFWRLVKEIYRAHGKTDLRDSQVADFGAGWGRITRFMAKDVPSSSVFAIEPNPHFCRIFKQTRVPGRLIETEYLSARRLPVEGFHLMISFSIMTHASHTLAQNIRKRWAEMMAPGGVVVFTIRPGTFLLARDGEMAKFTPDEQTEACARYSLGQLAYKAYADSPEWGVTITPMSYLRTLFGEHFNIVGPQFFFQNYTQLPVLMIRKG